MSVISGDPANISGSAPAAGNRPIALEVRFVGGQANRAVADRRGRLIAGGGGALGVSTADGLNIRVLNLSYGTDSTQSSALDPLSYAVEQAWRQGIVVVVAAGNDGTTRQELADPAADPYVIAVGAGKTSELVALRLPAKS